MCDVYVFVIVCNAYDIHQVQENHTRTYTILTEIQLSQGKDASHSTRFQPHHTSFPTSSIGHQPQPHQVPLHPPPDREKQAGARHNNQAQRCESDIFRTVHD